MFAGFTRDLDKKFRDWDSGTLDGGEDQVGDVDCVHSLRSAQLAGKEVRTASRVLVVGHNGVVIKREVWRYSRSSLIAR